jgi:hypothetical protein
MPADGGRLLSWSVNALNAISLSAIAEAKLLAGSPEVA